MQGDALVVILGGANCTPLAPPHSHLNALDCDSPKALTDKLVELDQNKLLCLSCFWWKKHYKVHTGTAEDHASSMCRLCGMLHDKTLPPKVHRDMSTWHGTESQCWNQLPEAFQNVPRKETANENDGMASF